MLMVVFQEKKQSFMHEDNYSKTVFMISPVFESLY